MVQGPIPIHEHSPSLTQTSSFRNLPTPHPLVPVVRDLSVLRRILFEEIVVETIFL